MRAQCLLGHSVVSDSLWFCELKPTRLLCPWDFSGKNTGVGCHFLLQDLTYIWTKVPTELLSSILHYIFLKSMLPYFITLSFHVQQFGIELFPHFLCFKGRACRIVRELDHKESWAPKKWWSLLKLMPIELVMPSRPHPLPSPSPPDPNPSQHQGLFQGVNSSHEVAKVLELQPQHQSFQCTPGTYLLQDQMEIGQELGTFELFPIFNKDTVTCMFCTWFLEHMRLYFFRVSRFVFFTFAKLELFPETPSLA